LKKIYPDHFWQQYKFFEHGKKSSQAFLKGILCQLLPNTEIVEEYTDSQISSFKIDLYVPTLSLGFEYHGQQHYNTVPFYGIHQQYIEHDAAKKEICRKLGINLVEVPYWWDMEKSSLAASINAAFPGIIQDPRIINGLPIPLEPPRASPSTH